MLPTRSSFRIRAALSARSLRHGVCAGLVALAWGGEAVGQDAPAAGPRKQVSALRIEGRAPVVDGRLDETVWRDAPVLGDFTQREPEEGAPARDRTEIRFLYDDAALYVGARMYSSDPSRIQAPVSRRDNGAQAEQILVSLDTYLDRRTAYTFGVTASGVRLDWYHPGDREGAVDRSFDPVWEARVQRDSLGWTAELRIPYSQLRFNRQPVQTWGINVRRWVPTSNEESYWVMVPPRVPGWASRFGDLAGLEGIRPTRRIELMPYAAGGATFTGSPEEGNPFDDGSTTTTRVGGDLKMGLGPNLTLEGTINPDFGQVEADPAEVNLSAFETIFPERRPFFVEASQLLAGNGPAYFYTRRVGAAPRADLVRGLARRADGSYTYLDAPSTSRILGAAKLTGRLASGTSVGALAAVTGREEAHTFGAEHGHRQVTVAPVTGYGVLRMQQEVGGNASTLGLSLTGLERDLADGDPLGSLLTRRAFAGGGDWNLRFDRGTYEVNGYVGFSYVEGDSAAVRRVQTAPARYFQRPDADHVDLDPARTSLAGYTAALGISKNGGRHWLWGASVEARSPEFEINDVGQVRTADDIWTLAHLTYRQPRPGELFRNYRITLAREDGWNFGGDYTWGSLRADGAVTWKNFWSTVFSGWIDLPAQSEDLTRGGPLVGRGYAGFVQARVANSPAARTRLRSSASYGESDQGQETYSISAGVAVRPAPAWQISVDPSYQRNVDPRQPIGAFRNGPEATWGRSYVFSFVESSTLGLQFRLNHTFTPDLSLEMYAEPFAASGRFYGFGELPAPGSREVRTLSGEEVEELRLPPLDFNIRSFRSNAVLRWEWTPGSTLFVVWQQDRFARDGNGGLVGPGALWNSLSTSGDNILALKMTYWLPVR